jgi:hypothetical protein
LDVVTDERRGEAGTIWFLGRWKPYETRVRPDVTTATAPSAAPLTAVDRCDRCGAQAYLRVLLQGGGELLFCAHHAREHGDKLREVASHVQDETAKLSNDKTPAPDAEH